MTDLSIIKKESKISAWGDRAEVREIAKRIQLMVPGGKKLNEEQALALAQGAVAHGLDPFNGEIWYIPGSGLMAGIKGLRKAAHQQIDGNYWTEFEQIVDPDKRSALLIPEGALAFRCILRDSETILAYAAGWKELADTGVPVKVIPTIVGVKPYTEGIGYFQAGEQTRMDPAQVAMKRAEADATKRRFDLPFAIPSDPNGEIITAEWHEVEDTEKGFDEVEGDTEQETTEPVSEEPAEEAKKKDKRPLSPSKLKARLKKRANAIAKEDFAGLHDSVIGATIGNLETCFAGDKKSTEKRHSVTAYIFGQESFKDLTDPQILALKRWLNAKEDSGGAWTPDPMSVKEANAVVKAHLKKKGQQEMGI